jgi:hypothetical protein
VEKAKMQASDNFVFLKKVFFQKNEKHLKNFSNFFFFSFFCSKKKVVAAVSV